MFTAATGKPSVIGGGGGVGGGINPPAGQIGGTELSPTVVGITESGGTPLSIGAIADGQMLLRSGSTVVGTTRIYQVYRSVKEWGATGDGTTDDTAAIQDAVDDLKTVGGCLYFPTGVYKITNLDLSRINTGFATSLAIIGDGPEASVLSQTTPATGNALDISGSNWLQFQNIGIEPGPNSAIGVLAARLTTAQNCNNNTFINVWIVGSTTKACFVAIGAESMVFDRCRFETGGQTTFYVGSYNKLTATSASGTIQTGQSATANHLLNCRFASSLTAPPVWVSEGTGIDFTGCETYATGANTFSSHVYADADTTNQSGWMVKFDKCHFEGNGDIFEFANGASPPTNAVYENWVITNNLCANSGYKWITVGGTDVSHTGLIFEGNVGPYAVELQDVELSRIYHVQAGATLVLAGAANGCDIRIPDGGLTGSVLGSTLSTVTTVGSSAKNFDKYGGASGQNGRYVQYTAATSAPAAGQLTAGMIAYADPASWDPAGVGGTVPYYAQYNGSAWKRMAETTVRKNSGADVGTARRLNFIEGANVTLTVTDDAANNEIDIEIAASGAGSGITQLTGDVTAGPGSGSQAATIPNGTVTYAKMQDVSATDRLLGRSTAGAGDVEEIVCTAAGRAILDDVDAAAQRTTLGVPAGSGNSTGTNTGDQTITLTNDVTGSGTGSFATTIANDAVTNAKAANVATATIKGRVTAGTGDPEDLTGTQATTLLDTFTSALKGLAPSSGGGTTNYLRADGTWAAPPGTGSGITELTGNVTAGPGSGSQVATIANSAVTYARIQDVAGLSVVGRSANTSGVSAAITGADGNVLRVSGTTLGFGEIATAGIANDAVTTAKLANVATATIKGRTTAGTGDPEDLTGTQATALLDVFTTSLKGLAPSSGGGTTNFLRADGTWAAPAGGGAPGGSTTQVQYNNAGAFAGAANVEIENNNLRLEQTTTPATPAAGGLSVYGKTLGGYSRVAYLPPNAVESFLQPALHSRMISWVRPIVGTAAPSTFGLGATATGTQTAATWAITNQHQSSQRNEYLVTVASTSAVAGVRAGTINCWIGSAAGLGGFLFNARWGPATGVATATARAFFGLRAATGAPTDVQPSSLVSMIGMGWDAADTNIQMMHNDSAGTATKIDLGASFPVPSADRTAVYEITIGCLPNASSVDYLVTDVTSGATASGTISTDLPANTAGLGYLGYCSVGGTSSVIGLALMRVYLETFT